MFPLILEMQLLIELELQCKLLIAARLRGSPWNALAVCSQVKGSFSMPVIADVSNEDRMMLVYPSLHTRALCLTSLVCLPTLLKSSWVSGFGGGWTC